MWTWAVIGAVLFAISLFMGGVIGQSIRIADREDAKRQARERQAQINHERLNGSN